MHQNSQIMKNYVRKIELHHDKCDVQFIKPEKWVYEETLDREASVKGVYKAVKVL